MTVPQPDDPLDSGAVADHHDQLLNEISDAIPALKAEKAACRKQAIEMLEELLDGLPVDDDTMKGEIVALK